MTNTFEELKQKTRQIRNAQINCIIARTLIERNESTYNKNDINAILHKIYEAKSKIRSIQLNDSKDLKESSECFFL